MLHKNGGRKRPFWELLPAAVIEQTRPQAEIPDSVPAPVGRPPTGGGGATGFGADGLLQKNRRVADLEEGEFAFDANSTQAAGSETLQAIMEGLKTGKIKPNDLRAVAGIPKRKSFFDGGFHAPGSSGATSFKSTGTNASFFQNRVLGQTVPTETQDTTAGSLIDPKTGRPRTAINNLLPLRTDVGGINKLVTDPAEIIANQQKVTRRRATKEEFLASDASAKLLAGRFGPESLQERIDASSKKTITEEGGGPTTLTRPIGERFVPDPIEPVTDTAVVDGAVTDTTVVDAEVTDDVVSDAVVTGQVVEPAPPVTLEAASREDQARAEGLDLVTGIARGESPVDNAIAAAFLSQLGSIDAVNEIAVRQDLAQRGITGAAATAALARHNRGVESERYATIGKIAINAMQRAENAAEFLATEGRAGQAQELQQQIHDDSEGWKEYDKLIQAGDYEGAAEAFTRITGQEMDPTNLEKQFKWKEDLINQQWAGWLIDNKQFGAAQARLSVAGIEVDFSAMEGELNQNAYLRNLTVAAELQAGGAELGDTGVQAALINMWDALPDSTKGTLNFEEWKAEQFDGFAKMNDPVFQMVHAMSDDTIALAFPDTDVGESRNLLTQLLSPISAAWQIGPDGELQPNMNAPIWDRLGINTDAAFKYTSLSTPTFDQMVEGAEAGVSEARSDLGATIVADANISFLKGKDSSDPIFQAVLAAAPSIKTIAHAYTKPTIGDNTFDIDPVVGGMYRYGDLILIVNDFSGKGFITLTDTNGKRYKIIAGDASLQPV